MHSKIKASILLLCLLSLVSCRITINKDHVAEGYKLLTQGDYFNADLEFDDALFADGNNLDALRGSYMCAMQIGNNEKALKRANKFVELKPDSSVGYHDRGLVYQNMEDYQKALANFDKAIRLGVFYPTIAYFNKAESLRKLARFDEAIVAFNIVLSIDKNDARAYYMKGVTFELMKNMDSACASFKLASLLGDESAEKKVTIACK
jgi:tetratricopeptide (TPR) repeat protein